MQKINLKKTTKDKLYALLVELGAENERLQAELETKKMQDLDFETEKMVLIQENEELGKEKTAILADLRKVCEKEQEISIELDRVKVENEGLENLVLEQSAEILEAKKLADAHAAALKDLDDAQAANDKANAELAHLTAVIADRMEDIAHEEAVAEGYGVALKWCIEHPWKNLWKCLKNEK